MATTRSVVCTVNGRPVHVEAEPRTSLLDLLRGPLGLTGAHSACEQGSCGACTVLLDGSPVCSCLVFAVQIDGHEVTTIEGIAPVGALHPLQEAMHRHHALQCGFCTPGIVLAALALLADADGPLSRSEIEAGLSGNLCRCTGYQAIVDAVFEVAGTSRGDGAPGGLLP